MELLTESFPSPETIKDDIIKDGFHIYENAVNVNVIEEIKNFWLDYFSKNSPDKEVMRGDLWLGQENFNSFTDSDFWTLYRHFDFLWNDSTHELTKNLSLELNKIRNKSLSLPEDYGLYYSPDCYSIYTSTSYYPPNTGRLETHEDGYPSDKDQFALLHFMVPVTFKGVDYEKGGLVYYSKSTGEKIDVDALMKPGSVLFFDGAGKHGVEKIIPFEDKKPIGRLAFFAIPAYFHKRETNAISNKLASQKKSRFSRFLSK